MLPMYMPGRFLTGSKPSSTCSMTAGITSHHMLNGTWDSCSCTRSKEESFSSLSWPAKYLYLIYVIFATSQYTAGPRHLGCAAGCDAVPLCKWPHTLWLSKTSAGGF